MSTAAEGGSFDKGRSFIQRNHPYFASRFLRAMLEWTRSPDGLSALCRACDEVKSQLESREVDADDLEGALLTDVSRFPERFAEVRLGVCVVIDSCRVARSHFSSALLHLPRDPTNT